MDVRWHWYAITCLAAAAATFAVCHGVSCAPVGPVQALERASQPDEVLRCCLEICKTGNEADVQFLVRFLTEKRNLLRLDSEEEYTFVEALRLRVTQVVNALSRLPRPRGEHALLYLFSQPEFRSDGRRIVGLISSCGNINDPSDDLLRHLDKESHRDSGYSGSAIEALAAMNSYRAAAIIERRIWESVDGQPSMFGPILSLRRTDPPIVALFESVIGRALEGELLEAAAEALFEYNGQKWFPSGIPVPGFVPPKPPRWADASSDVLRQIHAVGKLALGRPLSAARRRGVEQGMDQIEQVLAARCVPVQR